MIKTALIYNPYWHTLGGGERYTASVAEFLIKQGWQVDIYWPNDISSVLKQRFNIDLGRATIWYFLSAMAVYQLV